MAHGGRNDDNDGGLYESSDDDIYRGNDIWISDAYGDSQDDNHIPFCNARKHAHAVYAGYLFDHEQKIHQRLQITKQLPL